VVARFGRDTGRELLFVAYPALHHGNEMDEPLRARRRPLDEEDELWIGLGAGQSKGGLAAACAAVRLLQSQGVELAGRLTIAVSSEGSSSHVSAESLYRNFDVLPAGAVLLVGTENRITLGNRGRVDVHIEIRGKPTHSSAVELGVNPIPLVGAVQAELERVRVDDTSHPQLGRRALVPYKLMCGPVVPHTIPAWCRIVLDRRLLPGDDPDDAVAEIADALRDLPVVVSKGPAMLPALVREDDEVVAALQAGARAALGRPLETFYPRYTFDAGYGCALGVPTVMCGPSSSDISGADVLGEDVVALSALREAACVFAAAISGRRLEGSP
jgi:succinyl-diaminopimelate desuccinylase